MPEIKHNFTGGKMNKDLDERLVPNGEYRDAMNVQVSTSEGSDVGAVQNILGNTAGCSTEFNNILGKDAYTVGSISDEKNDSLYWFVSGNSFSSINSFISGFGTTTISEQESIDLANSFSMKDFICKYSSDNGCELVFVDKYAFYVPNEEQLVTNSNELSLINFTNNLLSEIEIGWNVVGVNIGNTTSTSNAVEVSDITNEVIVDFEFASEQSTASSISTTVVGPDYTVDKVGNDVFIPMLSPISSFGVTPTTGYNPANSNIIYISEWTGGSLSGLIDAEVFLDGFPTTPPGNKIIAASFKQMVYFQGDPIYEFSEQVVELQLETPYNYDASTVSGSISFIGNFTLSQPTPAAATGSLSAYSTSFAPNQTPLTLRITRTYTTTTDVATGWLYLNENQYNAGDLNIGDQVQYDGNLFFISDIDDTVCGGNPGPSGLCNAIKIQDANQNELSGFPVGVIFNGIPTPIGGQLQILTSPTIILNDNLNLTGGYQGFMFYGPRTLNFNHNQNITGIDIIDDMLFFTDGKTEPKKINISRSIEGTDDTGIFSTRLINKAQGVNYSSNIIAREEHITVIRKSPKNALTLELNDGRDKLLDYTGITTIGIDSGTTSILSSSNTNVQFDFSALQVGDTVRFSVETDINLVSDVNFAWEVGGYLLLKEFNLTSATSFTAPATPLADWTIRGLITDHQDNNFDSNNGTVQVQIQVVGLNGVPSSVPSNLQYIGKLNYVVDYEDTEPVIFEDKFPRFSYRYKYEDGEYSTFAPWSEVAFLPTSFNYDPKKGWNKGMINNLKSIKIKGFKPTTANSLLGRDIVEVDILYKEDAFPNVYLVQTISPIDIAVAGDSRPWDTGEYLIKSETIKSTIDANQLLRTWDNVPKTALAQAVSGSRIIYGNYEQNYDLKVGNLNYQPDFKNSIYSWTPSNSGTPKKSIKSLRDYKLGVVFTDEYGRETPVLISETGGFRVKKTESINANKLKVGLQGAIPPEMLYYKFYIKETSSEYYNVPMDRWYKAEDGNIWLAFPSSDRNKIDLDTFLYFKRGAEGDKNVIENSTKYKVLAIENEAPEFIKTRRIRIGTISHFNTGSNDQLFYMNNQPPKVNGISFTMSYGAGFASTSLSRMEDITEDIYVQFVSAGDVSQQYKVSEITSNRDDSTSPNTDPTEYYVTLATNITNDIDFIFDNSSSINEILDETKIVFTKAVIENKPQFDGRFFVKIENDGKIQTQITDDSVGTNYVETTSKQIYLLDNDVNLKKKSAAAVVSDNKNWVDFDYGADSTVGNYDALDRNFNHCVARESYFHKTGNISILQNKPASQVASVLNSRYINNYGDDNENTPSTGQMGVWFIDQGTIKYTIPTTDNDDNDLVWPNSSNMNDEFSPECNNAADCGYTGASSNVGDGIQNTPTSSIINLGFGGFDFLPRDNWSGGVADDGTAVQQFLADNTAYNPDTTFSDYYGTFSDYFSFGNGTRVSNSATFANSLAAGFRFKWKEDPTETIYTITSQTGYRRNARFARYDHGWPEDGNSSSVEPQLMLMSAASSYTKTFNFEVTPPISSWNPAEAPGVSITGGLHLGDGQFYTVKSVGSTSAGLTITVKDGNDLASSIKVGMSAGTNTNITNTAVVSGVTTSGNTLVITLSDPLNAQPITGTISDDTDIEFGFTIRLLENNMYGTTASPTNEYNHIVVDNIKTECSNGNDLKTIYSLHKGMKLLEYNIDTSATNAPKANDIVIKNIKEHPKGWEIELAGYEKPLNYGGSSSHPFNAGAPTVGERLKFVQVCMNGISNFTEDNTDICQINNPIGGIGGFNELGQIGAVGYTMQFVEPVEEYADGGNLPENPFVWETEPKENTGLDVYYEISENNPTKLNASTINTAIPIGSTVTSMAGEGRANGDLGQVSSNSYSSGREIKIDVGIDFSLGGAGTFTVPPLVIGSILTITRPNGIAFEVEVENITPDGDDPTDPPILKLKEDIYNSNYFLDWYNCYSFGNGVESNRIKDTFNLPFIANGVKASTTLGENYKKEHRKNGLIYSGLYNSMSGVNSLNQFIAAEKITKDVNPIYGSIQKLHSRSTADGDLIALCEDRVLKILANKDAVFNADGNTQLTATNNVLGQTIPYAGDYGISKNPESFASESYRCYFTDKVRSAVVRLSKDGLTPISNFGMKDWFRDNLKLSNKLVGSYDDKKSEYNITLDNSEDGNPKTVTFKENVKGWVSFKSFTPENAISCANEYYTFKQGELWKHHVEKFDALSGEEINRNTFYNIPKPSEITIIFNENPGIVKSFKTLNYEGSQSNVNALDAYQVYLPGTIDPVTGVGVINPNATAPISDNEYYNLIDKAGWYVETINTDLEKGSVKEFIEKEGKWFNHIKGVTDSVTTNGIFLSDFDSADSSFQGLGRLSSTPTILELAGCTDPNADNYNPQAGIDNGTCATIIYGCTDPDADSGYNPEATIDDGSCVINGCTDATAFNYNINATNDDNSCIPYIMGCTDSTAFNHDSLANTDDGSCIAVVSGCTDSTAINYSALANTDDFSCTYPVSGCTDPMSCDYNSLATTDDGSCTYCNHFESSTVFNYDGGTCNNYCTYCDAANNLVLSATHDTITVEFDEPTGVSLAPLSGYSILVDSNDDDNYSIAIINSIGPGSTLTHTFNTDISAGVNYTILVTTACGSVTPTVSTSNPSALQIYGTITTSAAPISGCTSDLACNYDPLAVINDGSCDSGPSTNADCDGNCLAGFVDDGNGNCVQCNDGCTDPSASNHNSSATCDDGSCLYGDGCTESTAFNNNPLATTDDGSCFWYGCTDPYATNYDFAGSCTDSTVTLFDGWEYQYEPSSCSSDFGSYLTGVIYNNGSCINPIPGCMDNGTIYQDSNGNFVQPNNYNPNATANVGCEYEGCTDSAANNYGDFYTVTDNSVCTYDEVQCFNSSRSLVTTYIGGSAINQATRLVLSITPTSGSTYDNDTDASGVPDDFNVTRKIFNDNMVLIAEDNPLGDFQSTGSNSLQNTDIFYNFPGNVGLVDANDYVSQVTVRYIITTSDGLCDPVQIENTYTAGCKTSGGETVNGTWQTWQNVDTTLQLSDQRKCSTDSI